jgi:hypothetical protein
MSIGMSQQFKTGDKIKSKKTDNIYSVLGFDCGQIIVQPISKNAWARWIHSYDVQDFFKLSEDNLKCRRRK